MGIETKKIDSSRIKQQNRDLVYRFIRDQRQASKQDIVAGLRLSLPTVTQNLNFLLEQGLIDASRQIHNTGGRNATAFSVKAKARMAIGLNLTGHHMNAVSVDLLGRNGPVLQNRIVFNLDSDDYLRKIGEVVEKVISVDQIDPDCLLGVGLSVPGLISEDGEEVVYGKTLHFSGKRREEIARYIPYPVRLFHDSYTAGYAEWRANPAAADAFYISLGNSVGGAIIRQNGVYEGESRKAGEIGHMIISPNARKRCYCGNFGCFDTLCSANVLVELTDGNLAEFFRIKQDGNKEAAKIWNRYLDHLALAVHNIRMLFDTKVILGGYVGPYVTEDFGKLFPRIDRLDPYGQKAEDYVIPCCSKIESIAVGSARIFIDEFLKTISSEKMLNQDEQSACNA